MPRLEPEADGLLVWAVEVYRQLPRDQRHPFFVLNTLGGSSVFHPRHGEQRAMMQVDAEMLDRYGFISGKRRRAGISSFTITPEGFDYYETLKSATGQPTDAIEADVHRYLDSADFAARHPRSHAKWSEAARELWGTDSESALTAIGHQCREALQFFITELVEHHNPPKVSADAALTVNRFKGVLELAEAKLGSTEAAFLDSLLAYFGTVSDLAQRQEHAGGKEREVVGWEDARRLVFQTAVTMFEIDRSIRRALG